MCNLYCRLRQVSSVAQAHALRLLRRQRLPFLPARGSLSADGITQTKKIAVGARTNEANASTTSVHIVHRTVPAHRGPGVRSRMAIQKSVWVPLQDTFSECCGAIHSAPRILSACEHEQRTDAMICAAGDADDGVELPLPRAFCLTKAASPCSPIAAGTRSRH